MHKEHAHRTMMLPFKGMGNVPKNLLSQSPQDISLSSVVLYEIETGLAKFENPDKCQAQLTEFLSVVDVVTFDAPQARAAASIRAELERSEKPIGPMDNLIAGAAVVTGSILVARNMGEFERVPGLQLEDWF